MKSFNKTFTWLSTLLLTVLFAVSGSAGAATKDCTPTPTTFNVESLNGTYDVAFAGVTGNTAYTAEYTGSDLALKDASGTTVGTVAVTTPAYDTVRFTVTGATATAAGNYTIEMPEGALTFKHSVKMLNITHPAFTITLAYAGSTEPIVPEAPKYLTAPALRQAVADKGIALIGILGVTTTGDKYINGSTQTSHASADGTLAGVRAPEEAEVIEVIPAEGGYYLRQHAAEAGQGYLACAGGSNFTITDQAGANIWTIVGPDETGYGDVSGYDDIYSDIAKELNPYMVRFISQGQYLNGQAYGGTGGLRGGTGAWSFNYVYSYEEAVPADIPFTVGKKYVVWFKANSKFYFWNDQDGVANEVRTPDDIADRNALESKTNTAYWIMGGNATDGYTFTNATTGKNIVAPATLKAGADFVLSNDPATGFDVVKMDNGYYRFYVHGQTEYFMAHTSHNTHHITMWNVATYGLDANEGGAGVVQFEEIPDHYDYTLALVDAPAGVTVTIGGEARTDGAEFSTENRLNTADIAVVAEGYTYSIDITDGVVTITFKKIPFTAGKKYVISSVGHANEAVYYLTNDGTNTKLARSTEYPAEAQYWTAESVSVAADGGINVSFVNNGKYFAFGATTAEAGHAVKLTQDDVDAENFYNVQDYLNYWPDKSTDTRFLYLAVKDDNTNIGWGNWQGTGIRSAGYSYQFKFDEIAEEEEPVSYTEGDFYVKNEASGKYFGFVGTSTSDGNFGPVEEADKLVCTVTQPEEGTFNIQLFGFNYVSCGSNGGFSNNKAANALQLFKVNGSSAVKATTIEEGAEYLIVGNKNGTDYALSNGTNGKTGADLRTAGIAVTITDNTISTVFGACKWTFEHYVNTDTREALEGVYVKNGEGKFFGIGATDIDILDEGQTWTIAPVKTEEKAYTLENTSIDAVKRFVNTGSNGYLSKSEDYNARSVYFYELTNATTGECTLVEQPELGKTYAMVIHNITTGYPGYYAIYSGLANGKTDRGDVISLGTELPTSLTIDATLSSSNGTITPAKALWTLTDTAEEPEPEPVFVEGTPIAAIEEFTDGATVYLQDAKFSKYIVNATTVADEPDVNCYITLEQVAENNFRLKLSNGKYLSYDPETIGNDAAAYDEEDQAKATVYTVVAQGNYWRFQFAFAENATAEQTYNIVGGSAPIITWNKPDGAIRRNFTVYKVASEEPIDPEEGFWVLASEASAPVAGKTYALKNVSRNNYASNHGVQASFDGHVSDAVWTIESTGNTVDGAPTYYLYNKAEKAYWKNDDFEGNPGLDGYDIHNYCGTNAYWTNTKAEAMEVTILAAGSTETWRTQGAGSEGYILALNRVVPSGDGGNYYFKLGQQGSDLAMEPWDEDVAWYFYEATVGEEPVGPIEPEFPLTGQPYLLKEKDSGMYLNVIPDSEDNKKDVVLKKKGQDLYFTAVEGGYTITTADGLYVGGFSNGWNMSSKVAQTWVVEEVEGGYALRTADAGKYLGFDTIDNEGAAAYRDKNYATNHGIFEFELDVFPAEGKAYQFKEKDSGMFLNVIPDSPDNKKDVVLKKTAQALYFTAVEGGYTIATEDGLYVGASPANTWNMSSLNAQTWVVEEVEGGYALRTADAGKYLGFDTVDNEGAAAYRDKSYSANHGIFEITAYGTAELTAQDKLAAAIAEAKALNTTGVPTDLVEELNNAIEMAEGVLADETSTDADYEEAQGILEHAANAVKNYVPQTAAEMFADLKAALEQATAILEANKVEGQLNETTYEYELTSTVAGKVGYKPYDEVFSIGEDVAAINWILELVGNNADVLEALLNEEGMSIRMYTAELVDLIAAYEAAGWVLPEKDKTYIIRLAPDQYSWAFNYSEGALTLNKWSEVKDALTAEYAWTCKGLEEYQIVNSDLEVESLGNRVRFTNLAHKDQYLCWKGVTDNAKAGNTYWQISGKNSPQYGAMSMQAFDGSNHYKFLTIEVYSGSMNHGDSWNWVNNSTYSSWYTFEEVDPNQFGEIVGIGTVIAPADNALRFNIQGQRIAKDVRGISIVNGKKLIRK